MQVDLFDFELADDRIALRPARPRDAAKLLQVKDGIFSDHIVRDLPDLLQAGDVLVLNETKVMPAHLYGVRAARPVGGGGAVKISFNLHKQISADSWRAFARPAKRLKIGDEIDFGDKLKAKISDKSDGGEVCLQFNNTDTKLIKAIEKKGKMPLPPYIGRQRDVDSSDTKDYQTILPKRQVL